MLVSNLFENNPQENGMAVLKQLATAVRDRADIDLEVGNELLPIKYYQANHLVSRWKALASSRQQNQALASFGDINWINDVLDAVDARMAAGAKVGSVEGGRDVDEGWKSNLAGAALIGMGAMGSNAANARDLSYYNTDYLQAAAQGGKSMVSADDAKAELQQRAQGKQQAVSAPNPGTKASAGYSKEYLQSVIDGTHPRPLISKDRAQALLQQYQTNEASYIDGKREDPGTLRWKQTSMSYEAAVNKYGQANVRKEGKNRAGQEVIAVHVPLGEQEVPAGSITKNAVDINQIASQMKFLPTTKLAKQYKFVKDGMPGQMPAMAYTVATQEQPVVTITSDGKETQNTAAPNDVIMSGPSRENYVIKAAKFPKLYQGTVGGPVIPEQGPRLVALYTGKMPVTFTAPWDESMVLKPGDYLVKDGDTGYYRIAKLEYEQTYNKPGSSGQQAVSEGNNDEYNDESGMAYNSLRTIHRATKGLANTIKDGDNLPEWCQEKISLAEDYLVTVWDYLQSEKGMAEGMFTKAPAIDPIIGKEINNIINRLWIRAKQTKDEYLLGTVQELFDILRNTGGTYSPPGSPGVRDVAEGLGYSQDPAQAKWYHEGRKAYKFGTTGNLIQDIAKKHGVPSEWIEAFHAGYQDQEGFSKDGVAEDEMSDFIAGGGEITQVPFRKPRKAERLGGSKHIGGPGDPSTSRFKGISANTQGKAVIGQAKRVLEAPGDKGSSREHLAMLQAEKKEHEQAQRAKQEKMDRNLKNYQAGRVRASDIKVAEASKTRNPTTDFLRKHPVPDSEMVKPVKNQDADASFKNMMGGSSNELTKNLKIKEQESTSGDEHTRRQKLIKYLAKHKGWDSSDLEHATTKELMQYYKECRQGMAEVSDPSGMMHAARHYNKSFIITAELAEGGTKKYRVHAQSERVAREKFSQHYNMAKVLNVEEEGMAEARSADDLQNELTSWKKEGPWKKTTTKDPRGKAPNLSDKARRETEKSFPTTKKV